MEHIRQVWADSKLFRVILVITIIYSVLRLGVQAAYLAIMMFPQQTIGSMPDWVGTEGPVIPDDLRIYLDAAERIQQRQDLYLKSAPDRMEFYQYAPSFALAFTPFLWMSRPVAAILHSLLHIAIYILLYMRWKRIFARFSLKHANTMLAWTLPVWMVFTTFWNDMGYLNVYILMALLATLLIEAILAEHLGWALVWLSIILQIKPQWAFAASVPLLLGRYRFFAKLIVLTIAAYLAIWGITILITGIPYGWQQHVDYIRLLSNINSSNYPWRGPDEPFLGYNHSITQCIVYLLGVSPGTLRLATLIKLALLTPLCIVCVRNLIRPVKLAGYDLPVIGLDLAFGLYTGAYIWLNVVWELSLGIAVFTYLLGTLDRTNAKILVWAVFLLYALADICRTITFALFGMDIILPNFYISTDPMIYAPLVMVTTLTFYALIIKRLWTTKAQTG